MATVKYVISSGIIITAHSPGIGWRTVDILWLNAIPAERWAERKRNM
jgi:hypothetical protein